MRKLNLNWIYLVASVIHLISSVVSFIKGDIAIANTYLILSILFFNWHRDYVREANISALTVGKDLELTIERNKNRNN